MPTPPRPLHTIVALHGDLDIAAAPALREHLRDALHHSHPILILDLSDAASCDTVGLAVLIGTQRRANALGITLQMTGLPPQISDLLHVTGLDKSLTVVRHPTGRRHQRGDGYDQTVAHRACRERICA
jgi:anti-anti-sigma factor